MLAPAIVFSKADEIDSGSIEARLNTAGNEELRHKCAVELRRGGNKGLSLQTLLSE